jgi:hypothetical protein
MAKIDRLGWAAGISLVSYGVRIGIRTNEPEVLEQVRPLLPPGWKPAAAPFVDWLYSLRVGGEGRSVRVRNYHLLYAGSQRLARSMEIADLFEPLENHVQLLVAESARRRVFVHAGVVGWRGQAILIPGRSFTGKTTLVASLVRAGATYYSDEYAVLDSQGRVYPSPRRLSIREDENQRPRRCSPEALGGRAGSRPLPVRLVVVTRYRPGARWRPRVLPPGHAALALLHNTVPAQRKPAAVLDALQQVVCQATTVKGVRGEAEPVAEALLDRLGPRSGLLARSGRHRLALAAA